MIYQAKAITIRKQQDVGHVNNVNDIEGDATMITVISRDHGFFTLVFDSVRARYN